MEIIKITGIVIKTLDYNESSKIIYLYTKNGKMSFLFTGVKKFKSDKRILAQPFQKVNLSYYKNSKFPKPIDGDIIDYYKDAKEDIYKLNKMAQICDFIYYFSGDISDHNEAFLLLDKTFENLKKNDIDDDIVFLIFSINLLKYLGMDLNYEEELKHVLKEFLNYNYELNIEESEKTRFLNFIKEFYKNQLEYNIKSLF